MAVLQAYRQPYFFICDFFDIQHFYSTPFLLILYLYFIKYIHIINIDYELLCLIIACYLNISIVILLYLTIFIYV